MKKMMIILSLIFGLLLLLGIGILTVLFFKAESVLIIDKIG
ncbi:hypothetical protein [Brevibacillus brevis]|nr:hypothetical protein [Brevibacillus brevis]